MVTKSEHKRIKLKNVKIIDINQYGQAVISNCEFSENTVDRVFCLEDAESVTLTDSKISDNAGFALYSTKKLGKNGTISNCTFNNNGKTDGVSSFYFKKNSGLTFDNCDFGDSTFENKQFATFSGASADASAGSLFGEGSSSMLVSLLSLIVAIVSMTTVMVDKKKRM